MAESQDWPKNTSMANQKENGQMKSENSDLKALMNLQELLSRAQKKELNGSPFLMGWLDLYLRKEPYLTEEQKLYYAKQLIDIAENNPGWLTPDD